MTPTSRFGGIRFIGTMLCVVVAICSSHFRPPPTPPVTAPGPISFDWHVQQLEGQPLTILIDALQSRTEDVAFLTGCDCRSVVSLLIKTDDRVVYVRFVTPALSTEAAIKRWPHWCRDAVIECVIVRRL